MKALRLECKQKFPIIYTKMYIFEAAVSFILWIDFNVLWLLYPQYSQQCSIVRPWGPGILIVFYMDVITYPYHNLKGDLTCKAMRDAGVFYRYTNEILLQPLLCCQFMCWYHDRHLERSIKMKHILKTWLLYGRLVCTSSTVRISAVFSMSWYGYRYLWHCTLVSSTP